MKSLPCPLSSKLWPIAVWSLHLMPSTPKKTCQQIIDSGNHYLGALKGNHGNFFKALKLNFQSETHVHSVETGHGRVERRTLSLCHDIESLPGADQWAGLKDDYQGH